MTESGIQLRSVNELLVDAAGQPARYWIPSYQRGYRWTQLQVTELLDDIWEFIQDDKSGSFYCLQPLVVRPLDDGRIEVVDGQQRLTTIFIILTYLKDMAEMLDKKRFEIIYETRGESSGSFLENIDLDRAEENVDFYHICEAYRAVEGWFSKRDKSHSLKFIQHLTNDDAAGKNVKVIWYVLSDEEDSISAFARLNVGKIPLTNDELIRALFIRAAQEQVGTDLALRIGHEWDQIEKSLQSAPFWHFLSNESPPSHSRIGFVFALAAEVHMTEHLRHDRYGVFHVFSDLVRTQPIDRLWLDVKGLFMGLEEWYEDRVLFHMVGLLIHQGEKISFLLQNAVSSTKKEFSEFLRGRIFLKLFGEECDLNNPDQVREMIESQLDSADYSKRAKVRSLLLFFNIVTLLESPRSNMRFQFDSFKSESWDIEHVRSMTENRPDRHNERCDWLELNKKYLLTREDAGDLVAQIDSFLSLSQKEASDERFEPLYESVLSYFNELGDGGDDGIENLTLLDQSTNRSYKNAVFAVKRQRVLDLDRSGIFIPLCTRNIFLKCYNPEVDNLLFWSEKDAEAYREIMTKSMANFFLKGAAHD